MKLLKIRSHHIIKLKSRNRQHNIFSLIVRNGRWCDLSNNWHSKKNFSVRLDVENNRRLDVIEYTTPFVFVYISENIHSKWHVFSRTTYIFFHWFCQTSFKLFFIKFVHASDPLRVLFCFVKCRGFFVLSLILVSSVYY